MNFISIALCLWLQVGEARTAELRLPGVDLVSLVVEIEANLKSKLKLSDEQKTNFLALFREDPSYEAWQKSVPVKAPDPSVKLSPLDLYEARERQKLKWEEERIRRWGECLSTAQVQVLRFRF